MKIRDLFTFEKPKLRPPEITKLRRKMELTEQIEACKSRIESVQHPGIGDRIKLDSLTGCYRNR